MQKTIGYTEGLLCQIPELWEDCLSVMAATVSLPYFLLRVYCCKVFKNHYRATVLSHLHVYPVTAEPGTCYAHSFPKPGTVSCCQVTNCTLLATSSAGPSKHKREKTFKQSFCWERWLMMHSVFLEIKILHQWWFTGRSRNTCMSEWCRPSSWQRCLCESLFECMMQIIVLLKLLVQGPVLV